jgi:hypothetical protein
MMIIMMMMIMMIILMTIFNNDDDDCNDIHFGIFSSGDSGGGLTAEIEEGSTVLVGIVSFGAAAGELNGKTIKNPQNYLKILKNQKKPSKIIVIIINHYF